MKPESDENPIEKMYRLAHERGIRQRQNVKKDVKILEILVAISAIGLIFCAIAIASILYGNHQDLLFGTIMLLIILGASKEALKDHRRG